jgi:hypothetical protein
LGLEALSINLGGYVSKIQEACLGPCERDVVEKECDGNEAVLIIRDSPKVSIYEDKSCTFINGGLAGVDAFNYRVLGI